MTKQGEKGEGRRASLLLSTTKETLWQLLKKIIDSKSLTERLKELSFDLLLNG